MPLFSYLRSDYPLNLTLLEHAHACPSTCFYIAELTPRTIRISLRLHNSPLPISFYQRYCARSCSFAWVSLAHKSPFELTAARASLHRVPASCRRAIDYFVEHRCAHPRGSTQLKILWSLASLLLHIAAVCSLLGSVFKWVTDRRSALGCVALCCAVRGHRSKLSQIRRNT
jgi:hypothetical protein